MTLPQFRIGRNRPRPENIRRVAAYCAEVMLVTPEDASRELNLSTHVVRACLGMLMDRDAVVYVRRGLYRQNPALAGAK